MTAIKLVGTYRVSVSDEELRFITEEVTGSLERTQAEVDGLALIEVEVRSTAKDFDVGLLHQEGSEQAAWDERFFTPDGSQFIGTTRPDEPDFRVCFFLHRFDPSKKIISPYGDMLPTGSIEMPHRLSKFCVYEHPG